MTETVKQKTFWFINQYASTPETGMGGRHYYLAKELAKQGHKVYLIASGFTHLLRQAPKLDKEFTIETMPEGFHFVWIKMPKYRDALNKKRALNWFIFAWKLLKLHQIIKDKPDTILVSSPSLIAFLGAHHLAKKLKAKLAFEVRDIFPLTLIEVAGYSPKHPVIKLMQWVEDKAYRDSDIVLSNLPKAYEHMVEHGMSRDKFHWIPNGFDLTELENALPLDEKVKSALPKQKFIVGYTGTLGVTYGLDTLINAAKLLSHESSIVFILVGGGKEKLDLMEKAKGLNNVIFIDAIPKRQIQSMLAEFDVCYLGLKKKPMFRFGLASNKLPDYMLSSKPIINACAGINDFVEIAKAGLSIPPESEQSIVDAVLHLKSLSAEERLQMGQNGCNYALKYHNYADLALKLAQILS